MSDTETQDGEGASGDKKAKVGVKAFLRATGKPAPRIKMKADAGEGLVKITWSITGAGYAYVTLVPPGDKSAIDLTGTDSAGFRQITRQIATDFDNGSGGLEESVSYLITLQDANRHELGSATLEVKRPEEEAGKLKLQFSQEVKVGKELKLFEGHTEWFTYEATAGLKMTSGGLTYSGGEAKTTGDFFKELSERPGDAWDVLRTKLLGGFAPLFAADGDQSPFVQAEWGPPTCTNSDDSTDITVVEFALKFPKLPGTPEAKVGLKAIVFDKEKGEYEFGEVECAMEATINSDNDIPMFGSWTWNTPQGVGSVELKLSPNWKTIERVLGRPLVTWLMELLETGVAAEAAVGLLVIALLVCEVVAMSEDADVQKEIQVARLRKRKEQLIPTMINGYIYGITEGKTGPGALSSAAFQVGFKMALARKGERPEINLSAQQSAQVKQMLQSDKNFNHVAQGLAFKSFYDWLSDQSLANKSSTILEVAFLNAFEYSSAAEPTSEDRKLYKQITGKSY